MKYNIPKSIKYISFSNSDVPRALMRLLPKASRFSIEKFVV